MSLALYETYVEALGSIPHTGRFMPYRWSSLPDPLDGRWMPYATMLAEFAQGLANVINDLTHYERQLRGWAIVVAKLDDAGKLDATHSFVDLVATTAVNLPYVIRSRFAFAVAHLCHQANRLKQPGWNDEFPNDAKLNLSSPNRYGKFWSSYERLETSLETINGQDYLTGTREFRNVYTHRLEPRFVIGIFQTVLREPLEGGGVRYVFGEQSALDLSEVADLLRIQRDRCYEAFEAFQSLVGEQADAIRDNASERA